MKAYRVQVVATKTMVVTEEMLRDEGNGDVVEINEFWAARHAVGTLIEELRNNPNRGSVKVTRIK